MCIRSPLYLSLKGEDMEKIVAKIKAADKTNPGLCF